MKKFLVTLLALALTAAPACAAAPSITVDNFTFPANTNLAFGRKANGDPVALLVDLTGILQIGGTGGSGSGGSVWQAPPSILVGGYSMPANGNMASGVTAGGIAVPILCADDGTVVTSGGGGGDVSAAGDNVFTGQNSFSLIPKLSWTSIAAGATQAAILSTQYYCTALTSSIVISGYTGTPANGSKVAFLLIGCNGTATFTFPAAQRSGDTTGTSTFITPTAGTHQIVFTYVNSLWYYQDDNVAPVDLAGTAVTGILPTAKVAVILTGKEIQRSASLGSDNTYAGDTTAGLNAGATIAQFEAVYIGGSSTYLLADANGSSTYPAFGLAVAGYSSTNPAVILRRGIVRHDAWNWTPGGRIYLSATAGGLTQTAPSTSGDKVQDVGVALTADVAEFNFSGVYVTVQ